MLSGNVVLLSLKEFFDYNFCKTLKMKLLLKYYFFFYNTMLKGQIFK